MLLSYREGKEIYLIPILGSHSPLSLPPELEEFGSCIKFSDHLDDDLLARSLLFNL